MRGFIFYCGPSQIDGAPIVGIAVLRSANAKTGDMVQTYILRADTAPLTALSTGADVSICGACPHRPRTIRVRDPKTGRFTARRAPIRHRSRSSCTVTAPSTSKRRLSAWPKR